MTALWIILGLLVAFLAVILARACLFVPGKEEPAPALDEHPDEKKIIDHMQQLIRCKTVSNRDKSLEDEAEFQRLYALLPTLFPHVYEACECFTPSDRSLIYAWKGKSSEKPGVLMAHYDVVPVVQEEWSKPAFEAIIEDGVMWGRGTLDTKGTFLGALEAADNLIAEGFVPAHDLYLCFAGNEEISGYGAPANVDWLEQHGIHPEFVLDEGGAVVEGVFPGVKQRCAVVGIAEKGPMTLRLTVETKGGHASTPPAQSAIGILSAAVARVEAHPFPFTITKPAAGMFDTLARRSTFLYRLIFANLWCFGPVLNLICKKSGGELNALVRTTCAFTMAKGSDAFNVLPHKAWVGADLRIIPGQTPESTIAELKKKLGDDRVQVEKVFGDEPSIISRMDDEPWQRLCGAVSAAWPDAVVSPYLMLACSDSRRYGRISDHVYRFSAMFMSKEERGMIHGKDERIPLETLTHTVKFYQNLIRRC